MQTTLLVLIALLTASTLATARTWHVPGDAPTIQAAIDSAFVGDDVLIASGVYTEHDVVMKGGITVHSEQGPGVTTIDANGVGVGFILESLGEQATVEGFTIMNGLAEGIGQDENCGGGIRCVGSSLIMRDCVIIGCVALDRGGGIYAWESGIDLETSTVTGCSAHQGGGIVGFSFDQSTMSITDCEVLDNETVLTTGGITAWASEVAIVRCLVSGNGATWGGTGGIGCHSPMFTIQDCIVADNWRGATGGGTPGIYVDEGSAGSISGCTVVGNEGGVSSGIIRADNAEVGIYGTIIAFNYGRALTCDNSSQVSVECCDSYGNAGGDDLCGNDLGGNFCLDPLFCDAEEGDYTLDGCSPCLPGNHPDGVDCGLIGALGQGCGATAMEETSWGRIKSLYRR